jgi:hypothetical protein
MESCVSRRLKDDSVGDPTDSCKPVLCVDDTNASTERSQYRVNNNKADPNSDKEARR